MITRKEGSMEATLLRSIRSSPSPSSSFFCIMPSLCACFSSIASSAPTQLSSPSLPLSTSLNRALAADASVKVLRGEMEENGVVGGGTLQSTYYISHGAPTLPLEDTPARDFLKQLPKSIGQRYCVPSFWLKWICGGLDFVDSGWFSTFDLVWCPGLLPARVCWN